MDKTEERTAFVSEIFSSAQGEGFYIGRRQLFVRFCECHRNCIYCDTPTTRTEVVSVERDPGSGQFDTIPNPLSVEKLFDLVTKINRPEFAHDDLFITGGEPLLQTDFLTVFLPKAHECLHLPVHLETSGDLAESFFRISKHIDYVLMDIKLPSVTGEAETWEKHRAFLDYIEAEQIGATIKLVISSNTTEEDFAYATHIIRGSNTANAVVLQPMTAASRSDHVPTAKQVLAWQSKFALELNRSIRIIPQCHKLMGFL